VSSTFAKVDTVIDKFLSTLKRFPLSSLSAFLLTIILINLVDMNSLLHNSPNAIMASKIAFVSTLAIVLFAALRLLTHSGLSTLLGIPIIFAYYSILPENIDSASQIVFTRHILLILALILMIIWAPFIGRNSSNQNFWQWTQEILFGLITALFFSIIVYAGIAGAIYAIEVLFHIDIRSIRYLQIAIFSFVLFGVIYFLSQIPKHPLFLESRPYSKVKRIFTKSILGSFALIYFLILYLYSAKILLSHTWPSGQLSWIIAAFSLVAIITFLFWTPFFKRESSLLQRLIWLAIFLQTIMLFVALYMRVIEYGITYNRYLLGLFGLWLLILSVYFILFGKAQQKWIFFLASLLIILSQFGPFSANAITKQSQTSRLQKLLQEHQPLSDDIDMKTKYQISNTIDYLYQHFGLDVFKETLPTIYKEYKEEISHYEIAKTDPKKMVELPPYIYSFPNYATDKLGFQYISRWEWKRAMQNRTHPYPREHYFYSNRLNRVVEIEGYNYLVEYDFNYYNHENQIYYKDLNLTIQFTNNQLEFIQAKKRVATIELNEFMEHLLKEESSYGIPQEFMTYESQQEIKVKIIFNRITTFDGNITDINSQILLTP